MAKTQKQPTLTKTKWKCKREGTTEYFVFFSSNEVRFTAHDHIEDDYLLHTEYYHYKYEHPKIFFERTYDSGETHTFECKFVDDKFVYTFEDGETTVFEKIPNEEYLEYADLDGEEYY